jgi:phosphatidylinositol glycan class C protein
MKLTTEEEEEEGEVGWRKLLYIRQPYPDNYVDRTHFLAELRKNTTVKLYGYGWLIRHSLRLVQHLSAILIFLSFFVLLHWRVVSAGQLIVLANSVTLTFYVAWIGYVWGQRDEYRVSGKQAGKSAILFMMTLLGLTPILKTLTEDTSSDTVWVLTTLCLIVNVASFDYSAKEVRGDDSVALNAAIFASVLLASRLPTKAHVFGLMSLSVAWFALAPLLQRALRQSNQSAALVLEMVFITMAVVMMGFIAPILSMVFMAVVVFITIVCPIIYVYLQRYKQEIHGPWDEASLRIS